MDGTNRQEEFLMAINEYSIHVYTVIDICNNCHIYSKYECMI